MYATKRRRRNVKSLKPTSKDATSSLAKSNPSKRHRERLNSELELLASLLPFEQTVIAKLDKLSILRLAVSYLRTKSYFSAVLNERYSLDNQLHRRLQQRIHHSPHVYTELALTDTSTVLQALSGFLFVVTCDGEVFYASHTVEQYLGFHQSDIIHQSALELIHSEDREVFKSQLDWRSQLSADNSDLSADQLLQPERCHLLQRCFTVRFRCLLDNASGFITLEISGKIKALMGQKSQGKSSPPLALFALCCPFGPLPIPDVPWRDYTCRTKHSMDFTLISMDSRARQLLQYSDEELTSKRGYDLIHPDDSSYYSAAHQELIKTGSAGLIAYRLMSRDSEWVWLQTSARVVYKNSKPEFIIAIHRHLTEDEGRELYRKRGSEFKLPYSIIDINGCDSPQSTGVAVVSCSAADVKPPPQTPVIRPVTGKKPSATRNTARKRTKKDSSLLALYSAEMKNCGEVVQQQYQASIGDGYHGNANYQDMTVGCDEFGRFQPMIGGLMGRRDDDVTDCRCYYGNGVGVGAWSWAPENAPQFVSSYLYDQQRYLADYSMYGRLVTSPPPSLSNGYDALPVATTGALYEALTPPDDDELGRLHSAATTTVFQQRPPDDVTISSSSYRRNDQADQYLANNNNNIASPGDLVSSVGRAGYGVATPVIQMSTKARSVVAGGTSSHLTDLPITKTLSLSTSTTAPTVLSYNSPTATPAGSLGWYSTTQCAASRYRPLLFPAPEYHLPVAANCHMNVYYGESW